jgi:pyrroline-5-carboxylate reductase
MKNKSIGFIGGGRVTKIFLHGFKAANVNFNKTIIFDPNNEVLTKLQNNFSQIECESENIESVSQCDIVILAVHPPLMVDTLTKIKGFLSENALLVSLAPKINISKMIEILGGFNNIARVIPSAPGIINQGINPVSFAESLSDTQKNMLQDLLQILGKVPVVNESKLEAYALICAMGSTYFWFQFQKLKELALSFGMEEQEAKEVIADMIEGSINTLFFSKFKADETMDLIPVKPIGEYEEIIKTFYDEKLKELYEKIKS